MAKKDTINGATATTAIAVINNNIGYIQKDIASINEQLSDVYARKDQLSEIAKQTEIRLLRLETQSNLWNWMKPVLSAALALILGFLVEQYLMHLH